MNIYDTKPIRCHKCGMSVGEIDCDAQVTLPQCGKCSNPLPEGDGISYLKSRAENQGNEPIVQEVKI